MRSEAFDQACANLDEAGLPKIVREIVAKRIIDAAKNGELDPARLRVLALAGRPRSLMTVQRS